VPKRVDHEERRRQIADALLRAAAARGLHATGMREVAAEAGVSLRPGCSTWPRGSPTRR
jgi:AcrR family transcriptional regulator